MEHRAGIRVYPRSCRPDRVRTAIWKEIHMIRKVLLALVATSFAFTATACNTVKGAGKDIESVGQAGEDAIN